MTWVIDYENTLQNYPLQAVVTFAGIGFTQWLHLFECPLGGGLRIVIRPQKGDDNGG